MKSTLFVFWIFAVGVLPLSLYDSIPLRSVPEALCAAAPSAPRLMATQEEVKGFFKQYVERYNRMDTDGFLWLFSLKAKQNQWDGLPEIRKIYSEFFSQMISVENSIEDMKIEIYQNAAEVKARYVVTEELKKGGEKRVLKGSVRWVLIREGGMLKILSIDFKNDKTP